MRTPSFFLLLGFACLAIHVGVVRAKDAEKAEPEAKAEANDEKHTLRYKFHPGETIRWNVEQRSRIRMTVSGSTEVTEMVSKSVKAWRVTELKPDGTATFEHLVESVDMWNKFSGHQEVSYNSQTDEVPPAGFESVAESIGVPSVVVTMNTKGEILKRQRKALKAAAQNEQGQMTIPLPDEAIPIGHTWSFRYPVDLPLENGTVKKVKMLQTFELKSVKTGVATIDVATKILTPIHDPALEAKLIQREQSGAVRFDVDAGRVMGQQMDLDRRVVGFAPANPASSLHCLTRFTETLLTDEPKTASRPKSTETEPRK
ncbi:MAG: hypothetical protein HQ582_25190 [Planctomycetes bacterium]|nr:hypothetical protein [Planctomycetota bacterium]